MPTPHTFSALFSKYLASCVRSQARFFAQTLLGRLYGHEPIGHCWASEVEQSRPEKVDEDRSSGLFFLFAHFCLWHLTFTPFHISRLIFHVFSFFFTHSSKKNLKNSYILLFYFLEKEVVYVDETYHDILFCSISYYQIIFPPSSRRAE